MTREDFLKQLPTLVRDYKPSPDVLKRIAKIEVLMVVGPSGTGKTTLMYELGIKHVLSDNTREPRPGEREGIDFYFRQDYEKVVSELKNGSFIQAVVDSGGDLKATKGSSYPDSGMVVMAVLAEALPDFRRLGFAKTFCAFIVPPTYEEWQRRVNSHFLTPEQSKKRMSEAERSLEFALQDDQLHFILNDDLKNATTQLQNLMKGKIDKPVEQAARQAATQLLAELKLARN